MEDFVLLPQPLGVVLAVFVIVYLLCRRQDEIQSAAGKLHLRKAKIFIELVLVFFPLAFAHWENDIFVIARQCLGYFFVVFLAMIFGLMSCADEKKPQE